MGAHLLVLSESYPMNNNMTGLKWFSNYICALYESSLGIGRVKALRFGCLHTFHPCQLFQVRIRLGAFKNIMSELVAFVGFSMLMENKVHVSKSFTS